MNNGLYRVHRVIFIFYITFAVILALIGLVGLLSGQPDGSIIVIGVILLSVAFLHWCAAKGARLGEQWGKTTSRVLAVLLFFGFPIGTLISIYIFSQTGKKWQAASEMQRAAGLT